MALQVYTLEVLADGTVSAVRSAPATSETAANMLDSKGAVFIMDDAVITNGLNFQALFDGLGRIMDEEFNSVNTVAELADTGTIVR